MQNCLQKLILTTFENICLCIHSIPLGSRGGVGGPPPARLHPTKRDIGLRPPPPSPRPGLTPPALALLASRRRPQPSSGPCDVMVGGHPLPPHVMAWRRQPVPFSRPGTAAPAPASLPLSKNPGVAPVALCVISCHRPPVG